jgi:hypothetical protein
MLETIADADMQVRPYRTLPRKALTNRVKGLIEQIPYATATNTRTYLNEA